ncbi:hypothetical protein FGB62_8g332 [Gracilaria domingensis]|nr:hypothetical protein FGB62_8g332 [Gracilaria domingensis]
MNRLKTSRAECISKKTQGGRKSGQESSAKRATRGTHRSRTAPGAGLSRKEVTHLGQPTRTVEVDREYFGASDDPVGEIQPSSAMAQVSERNRTQNNIKRRGGSKRTPVAEGCSGSDMERPGRRRKLTQAETVRNRSPPRVCRALGEQNILRTASPVATVPQGFAPVQGIHGEWEEDVVG